MNRLLLRNPWLIGALILVGSPLLTIAQLSQMGELHTWSDIWHALDHASVPAFCAFVSWLLFQSPLSGAFSQATFKQQSTAPDGTKTVREGSIAINEPLPPAAKPQP